MTNEKLPLCFVCGRLKEKHPLQDGACAVYLDPRNVKKISDEDVEGIKMTEKEWHENMSMKCEHGKTPMDLCAECDAIIEEEIKRCDDDGGHDYEVEADVGPDSGSETFCCKICPAVYHVTYY